MLRFYKASLRALIEYFLLPSDMWSEKFALCGNTRQWTLYSNLEYNSVESSSPSVITHAFKEAPVTAEPPIRFANNADR